MIQEWKLAPDARQAYAGSRITGLRCLIVGDFNSSRLYWMLKIGLKAVDAILRLGGPR